ncbi:MAG: hydroxyquinol 1,2-dioxygenase [Thermoleophilales bacterium]|jgi:catechol 1,2-dioxygenase|nr:hydroxyquinol 1,2-dioxygenase [Thermoleophilales bacterium]
MQARATRADDITAEVVERFAACGDVRLRALAQSLVRHMHAFAIDVGLTQGEWETAIGIVTDTGKITDDRRQEFVLWSDALGLSMLVDAIANPLPEGATESTVLGPFYVPGAPSRAYGESIASEPAGIPAWVHGRVLDLRGEPIAGAELDVWQNGANELYAVQDVEVEDDHLRGRFLTREDGSYAFLGVRPTPYAIPHDGPVGRMLEATGRHPWRPAHIHLIVRADGHAPVTTHIFDAASPYLESDAVFAVKPTLLRTFLERDPLDPERPQGVGGPWCSAENDIVLAPATKD